MANIEIRSLAPYCPLLKEKCLAAKCAWHTGRECAILKIARRKHEHRAGGKPAETVS